MNDKISLDEFCKQVSITDSRVELLGAFFYWMSKEKKVTTAKPAFFAAEYEKFTKMPA